MKSPAAHSYVTFRSHVMTCFESTIASLLLLSKKASLAIATIPSPKHNTASEKQGSGLLGEAGRREGEGGACLRSGTSLEQKLDI